MPAPLRFCFDFISPYAYVAWTQIHSLAERHGREVQPVPVLFAALLDAFGHKGPAEVAPKRAYVFKDAYRKAHRAGLLLAPPPTHPFNPLLALRVASLAMEAAMRRRVIDALFAATWAGGHGVESPEAVARALEGLEVDAADLIQRASAHETKARLRDQTAGAIADDVFGVPTVLVEREPFWGVDALELLETFLCGQDPVPPDLASRWSALRPSAVRPGATKR